MNEKPQTGGTPPVPPVVTTPPAVAAPEVAAPEVAAEQAPATTLALPLPPTALKVVVYSIPVLLLLIIVLAIVLLTGATDDGRTKAAVTPAGESPKIAEVEELKEMIKGLRAQPTPPEGKEGLTLHKSHEDVLAKLKELETRLSGFQSVSTDVKNSAAAATAAATAASGAATTSGDQAKKAAEAVEKTAAAAKTTVEAADAAKKAADGWKEAAEKTTKAANDAAAKVGQAATSAQVTATVEKTAENLQKVLEGGFRKDVLAADARTQRVETVLNHLIELNRRQAAAADVAVVISHGERCDARPLVEVAATALDANPARTLFKRFRVGVVVESAGQPAGSPPLAWPTAADPAPKFDLRKKDPLPDVGSREGQPAAVDPAAVFTAPADDPKADRRCVFVTHPAYPPPKTDAAAWKDIAVDAVLLVPAGEVDKLRAAGDAWAAFCRARGGAAVPVVVPDQTAKWTDADRRAVAALLRRLTAPY